MIIVTEANSGICNNENNITSKKYKNVIIYNNFYFEYNLYIEYIKFKDFYVRYYYEKNKLKNIKYFDYSNNLHREDGPTKIFYHKNGKIYYVSYYINNIQYSYEDYLLEIKK